MNFQNSENKCPRAELAAYIDGELSPLEELELESHLAACKLCATELNEQKRLLCALDFALEGEREFELPKNFTKIIVANAESKVSGLRSPKERFNAIFVVAALFLMFLAGLGGEIKSVAAASLQLGEQVFAVGNFTAHLIYDLTVGASVILRSISSQFFHNSNGLSALLIAFFVAALLALSRFLFRSNQS